MKIYVTENMHFVDAKNVEVDRSELTENQERVYKFSENMLKNGTDLLKIEARSRLAVNGLSFSTIYHKLGK